MNQHVVCGSHRSYLILAAAVFLFSIASSRTAFSQDAQEALRKSDTLISQGKLAEARDVLLPALDALPKDDADRRFDILFKLGYLLDKIDPKRGIAYLEEALKLRPKYATAWGNMGWNAYLAGDLEKAVSSTLRCLELDKTLAYAWANLGLYHFAQGETKKMDDAYNNAFHWADSPDDLEGAVTDAEELCQKKPGDECTKLLNLLNTDRKSLEKRPAHLKAWSVKNQEIRALLRKGSHGAALAMADSLLKAVEKELGKDHFTYVVTMSTLGVAQKELGKTAEAEETLLSAVRIASELRSPNTTLYPDILGSLAAHYAAMENWQKAEETLLRILRAREEMLGPNHLSLVNTLNQLAAMCKKQGKDQDGDAYKKRVRSIQDYQFGTLD